MTLRLRWGCCHHCGLRFALPLCPDTNIGPGMVPGFSHDQIQSSSICRVYLWTCEIRLPLHSACVCVCVYTGVESVESVYGVTITSEFTQTCPHGSERQIYFILSLPSVGRNGDPQNRGKIGSFPREKIALGRRGFQHLHFILFGGEGGSGGC